MFCAPTHLWNHRNTYWTHTRERRKERDEGRGAKTQRFGYSWSHLLFKVMFRRASLLLILPSICENSSCFWSTKASCQVFIIKYQCNKSALEADSTLLAFTVAVSVGSADFQKSHDKGNNGTGKRLKTLIFGLLGAPGQVDTVLF